MRKILIITFCLMLIAQSLGKYSDYHYYCNQNEQIYLSVFNANIWGLTYFADEPIPSSEENYDIDSVKQSNIDYMTNYYPNPFLLSMSGLIPGGMLIEIMNPSRKKKERLSTLCDHLINNNYDVVFLQEIWFIDDYEFLKLCTATKYQITKFDEECGRLNPMTPLECSGLVTLVTISKTTKLETEFISIPKGTDFATIQDPLLYVDYALNRKALIVDTKLYGGKLLNGVPVRFINTHLTPYHKNITERRDIRTQQAKFICDNALRSEKKPNWGWTIFGLDMNDIPGENSVYQTFMNCGFSDAYNPDQSDVTTYPLTYAADGNTWTGFTDPADEKVTIDYILAMGGGGSNQGIHALNVDFKDVLVKDLRTTTNNVSISDHNSVLAKVKLGCTIKN